MSLLTKNLINVFVSINRFSKTSNCARYSSLYNPDYLDALKPKIPVYELIDIQLKGYDFRILESYQSLLNSIADNMGLSVEECWAVPAQKLQIQKFREKSSIVETEYKLNVYERNIQLSNVPSTLYPLLIRLIETSLPEGVTAQTRKHLDEYDEIRYVPDQELKQLKSQLEEIAAARKK